VGRAAAVESKDQIRELLQGTKMVFITAGMGGGTGTGAAPVIAKIAKDMDILTVGIVTVPFSWEGKKKLAQAQIGIDALRESCDTVITILNDKLREIYGNLPIGHAFAEADNVLTTASKGIAEIITLAGYVNVDFQDVRTVMLNAGAAVMGTSETRGEGRGAKAAAGALASPLLDNRDIMGAKKILLSIISGAEAELSMDELTEITDYIQEQAGDEAEVIFGHGVDPELADRIRVTVIATGFFSDGMKENYSAKKEQKKVHDLDRSQTWLFTPDNSVNEKGKGLELKNREEAKPEIKPAKTEEPHQRETIFNGPFRKIDEPADTVEPNDKEGEDGLFLDDDYGNLAAKLNEEATNEEGLADVRNRLKQQSDERRKQLKSVRKQEMTKEDFNEKWALPAYLRRGVKMQDVPHSSESFISKYNLNDDNSILGNNKFLHDNVD
jgi:cell division protein FtsZ